MTVASPAVAPAVARRLAALGAGQIASSAPPKTIAPPNQIQPTSGDTIMRNWAGGALFR
jgi:hypothetical protein